jgi:hypothetical protein
MPRIFQAVFYLLGFNKEDICEPETNKLCWKMAKKCLNQSLLEKLEEYNPVGPKEGAPPRYRLINNIERFLEGFIFI